ncbi:MAG TPA: response regulator [Bacteroidales bacterium]|nr:response regulator [Bacteroidales bacterium]
MEVYKTAKQSEQLKDLLKDKKLLIVEDDDTGYILLKEIFADYKFSIERAKDGIEAISYFNYSKYAFDLVLMDLRLPNVNGFEATTKIKDINPSVPIIAVTAYVHSQSIYNSHICGCNEFIAKPFEINHLISIVHKYLTVNNNSFTSSLFNT